MLLRITALATLLAGLLGLCGADVTAQDKKDEKKPKPEDVAKAKKALMEVQDFIGLWNLEGTQKASGKTEAWKEKVSWGWKFKDGDAWMTVDFAEGKGKYFTAGTLRYDVEKKKYLLTLTGTDKTEHVFEGDVGKTGGLKLERKDAKTGDVYRLTLLTLADGVRFQVKYEKQDGGKGLFANQFAMNGNKDGESIAGTSKKPECIVSGGAASIAVNYQGKTYYCCCTGCRDEFNANPATYINAKKK
jgi:YHS domain-containing protein